MTLGYVPFLQPLPGTWHQAVWPCLLVPLCIAVAVVYKSIKCGSMKDVPKQAAETTFWILLGMVGAAAVLAGLVKGIEAWRG